MKNLNKKKKQLFSEGIEMENATEPYNGKMWVCYINKKKENWDLLVENDVKITQKDIVEWRYEKL